MNTHESKLHIIHMIDSIYLGQLNSSYQKDGFGIQQTFQFDTYIGYWRSNKAQGLGLVILQNGTKIYANFVRDEIDGLAIIDDGDRLRCGIFRNHQIVGVGFQYNYSLKHWRMNRYHKGIAIQTVKQQANDLSHSLPKIINVEQSIYFHMFNYTNKNYFPELQMNVVQVMADNATFYGYKNSKGSFGPGVITQNYSVIQAGFYEEGDLHGFGLKQSFNPYHYQFGCYHKGRKDGIFLEKNSDKARFLQYRKSILLKNLPDSQKILLNNQKKYNFNCKDFFSSKNSVPFQKLKKIVTPPQVKQFNDKKQNPMGQKGISSIGKPGLQKKTQTKGTRARTGTDYVIRQQRQKSSVQIMRQKMSHYYGVVGSSKKRSGSVDSNPNVKSPKKKQILNSDDDDGQIAKQENPFLEDN